MFYLDPCPPFVSCFASSGAHKRRSYVLEDPPDEEEDQEWIDMPELGDIKLSVAEPTVGWYKLNGQTLDPANTVAIANATTIFGGAVLPDWSGKYPTQGVPGTTFGTNAVTLTQGNLPDVDLPLQTTLTNSTQLLQVGYNNNVEWGGGANHFSGQSYDNWYVSLNPSGTQTDVDIVPETVAMNFLVWLDYTPM